MLSLHDERFKERILVAAEWAMGKNYGQGGAATR
jgi:hypothetical protein